MNEHRSPPFEKGETRTNLLSFVLTRLSSGSARAAKDQYSTVQRTLAETLYKNLNHRPTLKNCYTLREDDTIAMIFFFVNAIMEQDSEWQYFRAA